MVDAWCTYNEREMERRKHFFQILQLELVKEKTRNISDHSFSACAKFSEKLTFPNPWHVHVLWFSKILRIY